MDSSNLEQEAMRNRSYATRVRGLQKKIHEFSELCDVDACMLIHGKGNRRRGMPDMFPEDLRDLIRIVRRYLSLPKQERTKKHTDISSASAADGGKNKIEDDDSSESVSLRDNDDIADELEGDDRFNKLSADEIQQLIDSVDSKIDLIDDKIELIEGAEKPSNIESRNSDQAHGVANAKATTTNTSRGSDTSMQQMQQPLYVLQPINQNLAGHTPMNVENGSAMVPMMAMNFSNNGVTTDGSNVSYPMVMQYPMMATQPGGGNPMVMQYQMMAIQSGGSNPMVMQYQMMPVQVQPGGGNQGPVTCFMPVQPTATSYIPNLMPSGA